MKLVDTNIVVNLLIDGPYSHSARALYALDRDWQSESLLMTELVNVLATTVRTQMLALAAAEATLTEAQHLLSQGLRNVADQDVLSAAAHFGVSGYDARFLVVARAIGQPLITEDAKLRRAAPSLTCSIAEALAG